MPTRADDGSGESDLILIRKAVMNAGPVVSAGPPGVRSSYAKAAISGCFAGSEAKAAFGNSESPGMRYLACPMPP